MPAGASGQRWPNSAVVYPRLRLPRQWSARRQAGPVSPFVGGAHARTATSGDRLSRMLPAADRSFARRLCVLWRAHGYTRPLFERRLPQAVMGHFMSPVPLTAILTYCSLCRLAAMTSPHGRLPCDLNTKPPQRAIPASLDPIIGLRAATVLLESMRQHTSGRRGTRLQAALWATWCTKPIVNHNRPRPRTIQLLFNPAPAQCKIVKLVTSGSNRTLFIPTMRVGYSSLITATIRYDTGRTEPDRCCLIALVFGVGQAAAVVV